MTWLTAEHQAAIKAERAKAWDREFIIESRGAEDATPEYYEAPYGTPTQMTVCGDWTFREELQKTGSPGGPVAGATLILTTDVDHFPLISADGARLIVAGVRYAVSKASSFPESGECVAIAERVE